MIRALSILFLLALVGCSCPSAATTKHIDTQAAAHDGASRLIEQTLAGKLEGAAAADNVTPEQLAATPATVRRLLRRTVRFVYESRESWHVLRFTLGTGKDPATLNLSKPPTFSDAPPR